MEKYGEYEVNSKCVVGECEIERIVIDLTKPKPNTIWELEEGDMHNLVDFAGRVQDEDIAWMDDDFDKNARAVGNVFLTREEALRDVERRKVETLLLKYGGRRWFKEHKLNWFIALENEVSYEPYVYSVSNRPKQGCIYFDTEEQAQNAVKEIGEEHLKKALFEVK